MDQTLFAVYLGGRADRCNIELHDVVFVVGKRIEDTYPVLVKKWFGNQKQLHIDSYIPLKCIDGYAISLSREPPPPSSYKLYFVNMGAYQTGVFTEVHQSAFYVAPSSQEAVHRAREKLCQGMYMPHKDDVISLDAVPSHSVAFDVDDILEIEEVDEYYIHLQPSQTIAQPTPRSAYVKLRFPAPGSEYIPAFS
jgi:hypothetical protein